MMNHNMEFRRQLTLENEEVKKEPGTPFIFNESDVVYGGEQDVKRHLEQLLELV